MIINGVEISTCSIGQFCDLIQQRVDEEAIVMWPSGHPPRDTEDEDHCLGLSSISMTVAAINPEDFDKFMADKSMSKDDITNRLPEYCRKLGDLFYRPNADQLPPHRKGIDHEIQFTVDDKDKNKLPFKRPYAMTKEELEAAKKYLDEMLAKGFIRRSSSPVSSPVILVKKPGGGLRFCVDYRAVNAITIKNRYPIPRIRETLNRLCKAKYYSKFDIIAAFNRLRVTEGHEWKTAFTTRFGQFEYLVLPFGLCNAPSSFQGYINSALQDILDDYCTAYLDDVLVYSNTLEEHKRHVLEVLTRLKAADLHVDIEKSEFHVQSVKYLGLIITTQGLKMDPEKVKTVRDWEKPRNVKDILAFMGFVNFYRMFCPALSRVAKPLTELTKTKDAPSFRWDEKIHTTAFQAIKDIVAKEPVLQHYDHTKQSYVEVDASDYVTAGVLSQKDDHGMLRPVAFYSKKMSPQECNYEIYDKELLAIVRALEEWRPELASTDPSRPIQIFTDHRSLEYFMTTKQLNRRQARWNEEISEFPFQIAYRPGKQNTKADSLTRRSQDLPDGVEDERAQHQYQLVLKPLNLGPGVRPPEETVRANAMALELMEIDLQDPTIALREACASDPLINSLMRVKDGKLHKDGPLLVEQLSAEVRKFLSNHNIAMADCSVKAGQFYYKQRAWVPTNELRLLLLQSNHDTPAGGHPGKTKTYELLTRNYYWPGMLDYVKKYCKNCHICRRTKAFRNAYAGGLQQLPIAKEAWRHIAVDFVVELSPSGKEGYRNIMVVTDRLTKLRHYVACVEIDATSTAKYFLRHVWKLHGLPDTIVSDRGTQFTSIFWKRLCDRLQIKRTLSSAFHPETDGQSENSNQIMEPYIRIFPIIMP